MKVSPTTQTAKARHKNRYLGLTGTQLGVLAVLALANIVLVAVLLNLLGLDLKTLMSYYGLALLPFIVISRIRITRLSGSMTRGLPIWREDLPQDMEQSLRKTLWEVDTDNGFIRVDGQLRLVQARHAMYRTAWPYVARIDLGAQPPQIEYRTGLAGVLYLIPFFVGFGLFILAMMGLNHFVERTAIRHFICTRGACGQNLSKAGSHVRVPGGVGAASAKFLSSHA